MTQYLVYKFIKRYIDNNGYPPTFREISEGVGISISVVHHYMRKLRDAGIIDYQSRRCRTIAIKGEYHE